MKKRALAAAAICTLMLQTHVYTRILKTDDFSNGMSTVFEQAKDFAIANHNPSIHTLHLLHEICKHPLFVQCCAHVHSNPQNLQKQAKQCIDSYLPRIWGEKVIADADLELFLNECRAVAHKLGDQKLSIDNVLLTLTKTLTIPPDLQNFLVQHNMSEPKVLAWLLHLRTEPAEAQEAETRTNKDLMDFCTDITQQAKEKLLDPMIGRHEEVERMILILSRRRKNNPVLVGHPGVGKTAIVEGLAQKIVTLNKYLFMKIAMHRS